MSVTAAFETANSSRPKQQNAYVVPSSSRRRPALPPSLPSIPPILRAPSKLPFHLPTPSRTFLLTTLSVFLLTTFYYLSSSTPATSGLSKSYDYVAPFRPPKVNKEPYVEVEMPPQQMVVEALGKHTATVIFSHGLGDTARGWYPVAKELQSRFRHIKWILPTAPIDRVTLNAGMSMNSWFDIKTLMPPSPGVPTDEDEAGMLKSVSRIQQIIADEVDAGIDASRIVVGGFSQGACISILTGLTSERKLAGIVSLSGWLGLSDKAKSMATDHAHKLPILWGHGNADNIVRYSWGSDSIKALQKMGFKDIDFHTYPGMGHSFCDEEQDHLTAFIAKVLPEA